MEFALDRQGFDAPAAVRAELLEHFSGATGPRREAAPPPVVAAAQATASVGDVTIVNHVHVDLGRPETRPEGVVPAGGPPRQSKAARGMQEADADAAEPETVSVLADRLDAIKPVEQRAYLAYQYAAAR